MRAVTIFGSILTLAASMICADCALCQDQADPDNARKADALVKKLKETKEKYTTTVSTFNGSVVVKVGGEEKTISVTPGEALKIPKGLPVEKGSISWKDVSEYETKVMMGMDPLDQRVKWFIENIQTDRINFILKKVEEKLAKEWQERHPGEKSPSSKLSYYLPGKGQAEKFRVEGELIDQIVEQFGMEKISPFSRTAWKTKLVIGDERLYKADLRELCVREGILPSFVSVQSLAIHVSPGSQS